MAPYHIQQAQIVAPEIRPWVLDPTYTAPQNAKAIIPGDRGRTIIDLGPQRLTFNYRREWRSLGDDPAEISRKLAKELARKKRAALPPLHRDITEKKKAEYEAMYEAAGEVALFQTRERAQAAPETPARSILASQTGSIGPNKNKGHGLLKILATPEVAGPMLKYLEPSYRDVASLAATCRGAKEGVARNHEVWDTTKGELLVDDFLEERDGRIVNNEGVRQSTLVIAPVKIEHQASLTPYMDAWRVTDKLFRAIITVRNSFRSIILDQIPFLDAQMYEIMLQSMPNLESIAISRCILLDVTQLTPLIDAIVRHPHILANDEKQYRKFDFAPYFFSGPDHSCRHGSYGITHNEPIFNSTKAVFGMIMANYANAKLIGMDLLSERSSFWHFIKRLPGPDHLWVYKARDALLEYYEGAPSTPGKPVDTEAHKTAAIDDLIAALAGDKTEPIPLPYSELHRTDIARPYGYWRQKKTCEECGVEHFKGFFNMNQKVCDPCKMVHFRNTMEFSHLRQFQQSALNCLVKEVDVKDMTIEELYTKKGHNRQLAVYQVKQTDRAWAWHLLREVDANNPTQYAYPDPPGANPEAASLKRWVYRNEKLAPTDFRFGGPQCLHPGHSHTSLFGSILNYEYPNEAGPESFQHFIARTWELTERTRRILKEGYMASSSGEIHRDDWTQLAAENKHQLLYVQLMQWFDQNRGDRDVYHIASAAVEDNVFSLIGRYHRAWNRDEKWKTDDLITWYNGFGASYKIEGKH